MSDHMHPPLRQVLTVVADKGRILHAGQTGDQVDKAGGRFLGAQLRCQLNSGSRDGFGFDDVVLGVFAEDIQCGFFRFSSAQFITRM